MNNTDIKTVELIINSENAKKKLDELNTKLETARRKKMEAFEQGNAKGLEVYSKECRNLERQISQVQTRAKTVSDVLKNLDKATPNQLRKTIREINKELNNTERGTAQWKMLTAVLREADQQLKSIKMESKAATESLPKSLSDRFADWGNKWIGITATINTGLQAITGMKATIRETIEGFASMEEAESQVIKYTGMTRDQVKELNQEFKQLDTRTPRERLNALAGDAGRLGIQKKDQVLEFVDAADKINVALGEDLGEDAVKNIGKLAQLFGDDKVKGLRGSMLATASTVNELAQNSSAAEPYIVEFTGRMAGSAVQAKIAQANVMAYASVLDQSMVKVEQGSTALSNVLTKLYQDPAKFAKAAGIDVDNFTKLLKTDANEALLQFLEALSRKGGLDQLAPLFGDMQISGAGVVKVLSALASNVGKLRGEQELANKAFADGTSVINEFNVQNNTTQAQLDKAKKRFHDLTVELGEELIPVYSVFTGWTSQTIRLTIQLIKFLKEHYRTIIVLGATVASYIITVNAVRVATALWHGVTVAFNTVMVAFRYTLGLARVAAIAFQYGLHGASTAMRVLNTTIKANPIGLLLSVITTIIATIWAWVDSTKEENKQLEELKKNQDVLYQAKKKANDSTAEEIMRIRKLHEMLTNNAYSYDTKRKALAKLQELVPDYHATLSEEGRLIKENKKAIDDYIKQLGNKALAQAYQEKLVEIEKQLIESRETTSRKQFNIEAVNAEIERHPEIYKYEKKKIRSGDGATEYTYFQKTDELAAKEAERAVHEKAYAEAVEETNRLLQQRSQIQTQLNGDSDLKNFFDSLVIEGATTDPNPDPNPTDPDEERKKKIRLQIQKLEKEQRQKEIELTTLYATGDIKSYEDFTEQLYQAQRTSLQQQMNLWQNTDTEKADYQKKLDELDRKRIKENTDWSLHQIDVEHEAELKRLELQHIKEGTSEEYYQLRKDQLIEQHLHRRRDYLRNPKNGASAAEIQKAEEAHETETNNQALRRQQNYFKQLADLRKQYSTKSLQEQRDIQLAMLDELHAKGLVKEEEYQFLLRAIRKKHTNDSKQHTSENVSDILRKGGYTSEKADTQTTYGTLASAIANYATLKDASKDAYQYLREQRSKDLIDQQTYNEQVKALDRMRFTSFATMAQEAYSQVSAMMSSYSAFSQASTDAEVAKVEARYDKEIQAAGTHTEKAKKLEEQKTKEINAIKKKELKKQTAVQIAQAFASTAMNAILAYQDMLALGIPAGPVLAPIAAATAVAAGMLQIATIKKQAQAQLAEYYTGGFTGGSNYRRTAGIVHEGEFVANHQAVNNPNVLPILRLIDHAQKNNTIGSLTPEDISRTIAAPAITAAATEITSAAPLLQESLSDQRTAEVLERLNDRLDNLHAIVTLTGPDGLEEQQKKYDKLKRRK